ncbi:MAG TPA: metallophosphoesterase family protein [Streptosporangiaceae bacterium]|nr:metallophosphoesterase family protein [Streptosporangiaceae bacterium]
MDTPYGEIPEKFVKDMTIQEMHDYLKARSSRRTVLKAAGALGLAAAAGPVFWRQSSAFASTAAAPQWIGYGKDPAREMHVSWSAGTYNGPVPSVPAPQVRYGLDATYGAVEKASFSGTVPVPAISGEPVENTVYSNVLLRDLWPDTTYHYSVSNDGVNWSGDVTFTTASVGLTDFRFTMVGDEATNDSTSLPIAQVISALNPRFNVVVGDLSYAGGGSGYYSNGVPTNASAFSPGAWDAYLGIVGPAAAQSIPWQVGVGNHEMEPLANFGYVGFTTRFPQAYAPQEITGSPVLKSFTYGNVAVIQLDGNDLSAELSDNNGYTEGKQTAWLTERLAHYRSPGSGIDFIIVGFHNCVYSSNTTHGSDGGIRLVWEPIFDQYEVDLVVSGHVHAYERSYPLRGGQVTAVVPSGGTVHPHRDGTTYIGAGGGGQDLYSGWYGVTGGGDPATTAGEPLIWEWTGSNTATGGTGTSEDITDTVTDYSAYRHANWSFIALDVTAPRFPGGETSILVRAIDPIQTASGISTTSGPVVMDSVKLVRRSRP